VFHPDPLILFSFIFSILPVFNAAKGLRLILQGFSQGFIFIELFTVKG